MKLITEDSGQVQSLLYNTLQKLISNRINNKAFLDEVDVNDKAYFSTLEGIECLLIPFVNLPRNQFWIPLNDQYADLTNLILEDIRFILQFNREHIIAPQEQGLPYFTHRKLVRHYPYWTSECASFTISVLANYLELNRKFDVSKGIDGKEIENVILKNIEWVNALRRGDYGWAWINDQTRAHPWPTWSILDTFEEIKDYQSTKIMFQNIEKECDDVVSHILAGFEDSSSGSYYDNWYNFVINRTPYDVEKALDLTRLMLAVSLHKPEKAFPLVEMLYKWASNADFSQTNYKYHLKEKSEYIPDSSLVPCIFRALIIMVDRLSSKRIDRLNEELGSDYKIILNRVYSRLTKSLINNGKYENLWGVENDGIKYELYYTERTIEALTEFLINYKVNKSITHNNVSKDNFRNKNIIKVDDDETTKTGLADLPILDELARKVKKDNKNNIFNNVVIIYVLHFLNDLPPFVDKFNALGCLNEDMYFLFKTYRYPELKEVENYLKDKKCNIHVPENLLEDTFYKHVKSILVNSLGKCKKEDKKLLIMEDGGYFTPLFHNHYSEEREFCIGAVEQTTKGIRRDRKIGKIVFPIINVAESRLKGILESPEVAETLASNIETILRDDGKNVPSVNLLLLGFGTIGENLARVLKGKRIKVSIYDKDTLKRRKAKEDYEKYDVLDNLNNLEKYDFIIGTSGETSLEGSSLWSLKHNVILASGSSERLEIDIEWLENKTKEPKEKNINIDNIFTTYELKKEEDNKKIRVIANGEPINFIMSGGISKTVIDAVYSEMFMSAVLLVNNKITEKQINKVPEKIEEQIDKLFDIRYPR
jgi:S-adenosylhomocysteine hydrolase